MAVFTAIASAIVGAITGAGFTATFSAFFAGTLGVGATIGVALISGGLGMATAKLLGPDVPSIQAAKDPGVKVQLNPATDNRVPVFYGRVFTGAIAVDAGIKNRNNTMVYAYVIGEKTDTGTYSINDIYRGDAKLNFTGASVSSITDPNATSSTNVNGKMRCRVYAGNAQNQDNQIFPITGKVAAQTLLPTIDSSTNYENLVYAIFEVDYDTENGLTGLGTITYDITNSLSEPSAVLEDYLLNDVYGAGLSATDVDSTSFAAMQTYCEEQVDYTNLAGVTAQHNRWEIDGMLSTYQPVKTNIDKICQASSTFFTYNPKIGKFAVVPNRAATTAEKSAAFVFDNDNIISKIDINSTELYSMYNSIEAEYPAVNQKDQTSTVLVTTPSGDRNANEPDNGLNVRYEIVNDAPRVKNLSNIDLKQSRFDTLITFDADYSAIQVDVGDVVKVTEATYGYSDKLFRVMRTTEKEQENGMLIVSIVLLEYDDTVYTHEVVDSQEVEGIPNIPNWWTGIWGNIDYSNIANIIQGNITIVDDPVANISNIIPDPNTGTPVGTEPIGNVIYGDGGPINFPSINFPITIPDIPDLAEIMANLNVVGGEAGGYVPNTTVVRPPDGRTRFNPGETVNVTVPQPEPRPSDKDFPIGPLDIDITSQLGIDFRNFMGQTTATSTSANITLSPKGGISRANLGSVQAGLQYEEDEANFAIANSQIVNAELGQPASIISPIDVVDLGGIDYGEFSSMNDLVAYGGINSSTGQQIAFQPAREISYKEFDIDAVTGKYTANANADVVDYVYGSGIQSTGITNLPTFSDGLKYTVSETRGNLIAQNQPTPRPPASATKAYVPNFMNVINYANSDLFTATGVPRGFDVTNADKRISKSDSYLDLGGFF